MDHKNWQRLLTLLGNIDRWTARESRHYDTKADQLALQSDISSRQYIHSKDYIQCISKHHDSASRVDDLISDWFTLDIAMLNEEAC